MVKFIQKKAFILLLIVTAIGMLFSINYIGMAEEEIPLVSYSDLVEELGWSGHLTFQIKKFLNYKKSAPNGAGGFTFALYKKDAYGQWG